MPDTLPDTIRLRTELLVFLLGAAGLLLIIGGFYLPRLISFLLGRFVSPQAKEAYQVVVAPYQGIFVLILILSIADIAILVSPRMDFLDFIEIPIGLILVATISWSGSRIFKRFFDAYLLDATVKSGRKANSEFLLLGKLTANVLIVVIAFIIFAETHQINVVGLVASLGVGGLAVAFAAQKSLEQVLGGIVIYLDRPFVVDDYIGLPDGTFGRVESIGLRSTRIRTSGKGTLVIAPNSSLTQAHIENFTGAKKVISIIYLTFYRAIPGEERALIRQVILDSTHDIFGIDPRSTEVTFKDIVRDGTPELTRAQINFFILGSGEFSMELRYQLLDIAKQNITKQLKEYGIAFDIEERTINVDSPITI